ncbi:SOS response-associated peptidase [Nocardia camponoti]|nr:SOS response-associated peptidase [Nocardia camponoti]
MCGRYATTTNPARLAAALDAIDETGVADPAATVSYNVAPTSSVLTVVDRHDRDHPDEEASRRIRQMRWGLIPNWTKAAEPGVPVKGKPLFNARADKAATTPAFRDATKHRRCLVPMDGWYEWIVEEDPTGSGKGKAVKKPFFLSHADGSPLYMAGLWSSWRDRSQEDAAPLLSCTILTTDAVGAAADVHDRMPLALPEQYWDAWLNPDQPAPEEFLAGVDPAEAAAIVARPVSMRVNNVRNNDPDLLVPEAV